MCGAAHQGKLWDVVPPLRKKEVQADQTYPASQPGKAMQVVQYRTVLRMHDQVIRRRPLANGSRSRYLDWS